MGNLYAAFENNSGKYKDPFGLDKFSESGFISLIEGPYTIKFYDTKTSAFYEADFIEEKTDAFGNPSRIWETSNKRPITDPSEHLQQKLANKMLKIDPLLMDTLKFIFSESAEFAEKFEGPLDIIKDEQRLSHSEAIVALYFQNPEFQSYMHEKLALGTIGGVFTSALTKLTKIFKKSKKLAPSKKIDYDNWGGEFLDDTVNFSKVQKKIQKTLPLGQSYGKLGVVVEKPNIQIKGFRIHGLDQAITRGVKTPEILDAVKNPLAVLKQSSGSHVFINEGAAVVINKSNEIVTTYPPHLFDKTIKSILDSIK